MTLSVAALAAAIHLPAFAQETITPATVPTTVRARREAAIPPGFKKVEGEGRIALAEAADEPWVHERLGAMKPTSRPSGTIELLKRVREKKDERVKQIAQDIAVDPKAVAAEYDKDLVTPLQQINDLAPPIFYLVGTTDRVKQALKGGWEDPNFYYNRAADAVVMAGSIGVRTDGPMDDAIIPAMYDNKADAAAKAKSLTEAISRTETDYANFMNNRAKFVVGTGFAKLIDDLSVKDLSLKDDQRWYGIGIDVVLASKYSAPLTDQPDLVKAMIADNPNNPLRFTAVDLLHPPDLNSLNTEAIPFFVDTVRRKSAAAMQKLIEAAGPGAVAKTVQAVRTEKPADGAALVKLIQTQTGIDLTSDLSR